MDNYQENKVVINCLSCGSKLRVPDNRGDLEITCPKCNHVEEWAENEIKFIGKKRLTDDLIRKVIENRVRKMKGYVPRVGVFGVTGAGKSSLCNALFGSDVSEISDIEACTRNPQEIWLNCSRNEPGIILIDVPGLGESQERDEEYFKLYESLAPTLDLIIWVIKADDRAYSVSQKAYQKILKPNLEKCPVVFVINQVDALKPYDWDHKEGRPGANQEINIQKKINEVSKAFEVSTVNIIPASAEKKYNLTEIVSFVVDILPNEKKYSFAREANEEFKTEETKTKAEKGIWDSIKKWCGELWDNYKEPIMDIFVEVGTRMYSNYFKK